MAREHHPSLGRSVRGVWVPKPGGGVRRLTLLGPEDSAIYVRAVGRAIPSIERRLGPEVFANRAPGIGSLEPWRIARARWRRSTARLLQTGPSATMDVFQCYDSITPEAVGAALGRLGVPRQAGYQIVHVLNAFREAGVPGIPVGPEPSAILANAVLAAVDETLRLRGLRFGRWVDDVVLAGHDARAVELAVQAIEATLAKLGLASNPSKHHRFVDPEMAREQILGPGARGPSSIGILNGR